jgi:hypothetical protein
MSRYGTILGGSANAVSFIVEGATPEALLAASEAAGLATFGPLQDPVITSVTLTGAGDGHMFFLEVQGTAGVNADGGLDATTLSAKGFLGAESEVLTKALQAVQSASPVVDVQIAGAAKGQRVLGIVIFGTLLGGGGAFEMFSRVDCSVNAAYVESPYSRTPVLHTRSSGQVAGGYNGGGTGNKTILGFRVGNGLPLGQLQSIEYTWLDLNPAMSGFATYANLIIDVYGNGTAYKIAVIDPATPPGLNNGTTVSNPDGSHTTTWLGASNNVLIVNGLHVTEFPPPAPPPPAPSPPYVPPTAGPGLPPNFNFPGGWPGESYSIPAILAAFPNAKLAEASSGDGGLPRSPNTTPAFLLATGDSNNQVIRAFLLSNVKFNGVVV